MAEHGGAGTKYAHEGCRCDLCREANRLRVQRRRRERKPEDYKGKHGTASVYGNWNCRCEPCSEAHKAACKRQAAERKKRAIDSASTK